MPEAEQTIGGEYESITWHTFEAVDYERRMGWKAGSGRVGIGVRELTFQKTDTDKEDVLLPAGRSLVVVDTDLKLARKT